MLSVELGFAVLSIIAECHEKDFHLVERTLIREVLMALRDKNVPVRVKKCGTREGPTRDGPRSRTGPGERLWSPGYPNEYGGYCV